MFAFLEITFLGMFKIVIITQLSIIKCLTTYLQKYLTFDLKTEAFEIFVVFADLKHYGKIPH